MIRQVAVGVVLLGLLLLLLVAACGGRVTSPSSDALHEDATPTAVRARLGGGICKIGQRITSGDTVLMVHSVSVRAAGENGREIPEGRKLLLVDLAIENVSATGGLFYSPSFARLFWGTGGKGWSLLPVGGELRSGKLERGEQVRGIIAFDVPANGDRFTLKYGDPIFNNPNYPGFVPVRVQLY